MNIFTPLTHWVFGTFGYTAHAIEITNPLGCGDFLCVSQKVTDALYVISLPIVVIMVLWGAFPFFSAPLGWLGVFLTGSDTSANALFGNLQVVTANALGLNPVLTASVNSAAGVMGKMISLQSIAVAVAATGMTAADESRLFRFTIKHSIMLMVAMGIISMLFAYVFPGYVPVVPPK